MALVSIISKTNLASKLILSPERYDPRRKLQIDERKTVELNKIAISTRKMIKPSNELGKCLVIDTSDAREGIIIARKPNISGNEVGSAKKSVLPGDVIISRLRPYLRQVAFIDDKIPNATDDTSLAGNPRGRVLSKTQILCSTEFFILRSIDNCSIAFLVPFLLSDKIQKVLAVSQEGGHHPRFIESTLLTLPIPKKLISQREMISQKVIEGIASYRFSENAIADMVNQSNKAFEC